MANYEQTELNLHIRKPKEEQQSPPADSLKIPESTVMGRGKPIAPLNNPAVEELRQKGRLYTSGGGIHYGIPPEERSSTRWWKDATNQWIN